MFVIKYNKCLFDNIHNKKTFVFLCFIGTGSYEQNSDHQPSKKGKSKQYTSCLSLNTSNHTFMGWYLKGYWLKGFPEQIHTWLFYLHHFKSLLYHFQLLLCLPPPLEFMASSIIIKNTYNTHTWAYICVCMHVCTYTHMYILSPFSAIHMFKCLRMSNCYYIFRSPSFEKSDFPSLSNTRHLLSFIYGWGPCKISPSTLTCTGIIST